jgi:hypothetical protein
LEFRKINKIKLLLVNKGGPSINQRNKRKMGRPRWLMPVILAIQEAEIRRIVV